MAHSNHENSFAIFERSTDLVLGLVNGVVVYANPTLTAKLPDAVGQSVDAMVQSVDVGERLSDYLSRELSGGPVYGTLSANSSMNVSWSWFDDGAGHTILVGRDLPRQVEYDQVAELRQEVQKLRLALRYTQQILEQEREVHGTTDGWQYIAFQSRHIVAYASSTLSLLRDYNDRLDPSKRIERIDTLSSDLKQYREMIAAMEYTYLIRTDKFIKRLRLIEVPTLLRSIAEQAETETGNANRTEVSSEPSTITTILSEQLMQMVFSKLVSDALAYTETDTQVSVRIMASDANTVITVTDSGTGRDGVVQPFYRTNAVIGTPDDDYDIALVRYAVEALGGAVRIEKTGDNGISVVVQLPPPVT